MPYKDPEKRRAYLKAYHACWYVRNREERKAQVRAYKKANPGKVKAGRDDHYGRNKARLNAERNEYRSRDPEGTRAKQRAWRAARINEANEYQRNYYASHPEYREHKRQYSALYYASNLDGARRSRQARDRQITDHQWATLARKARK